MSPERKGECTLHRNKAVWAVLRAWKTAGPIGTRESTRHPPNLNSGIGGYSGAPAIPKGQFYLCFTAQVGSWLFHGSVCPAP